MGLPLAKTVVSAWAIQKVHRFFFPLSPLPSPTPFSLSAIQFQFNTCLEFPVGLPRHKGVDLGGDDIISLSDDWLLPGSRNDIISAWTSPTSLLLALYWLDKGPHHRIPCCLGDHKFSTLLSEGMVIHYMCDMGVKGPGREPRAGRF